MDERQFYTQIFGIKPPWTVTDVRLNVKGAEVTVRVEADSAATLSCPECSKASPRYDKRARQWRHLDTCQFKTIIESDVPRVTCSKHGVLQVSVPWARPGSGFTLLFEALVMVMVRAMTVAETGQMVDEWDTRLWRIIHHYVDEARGRADYSDVTRVAGACPRAGQRPDPWDETAARRGHNYVSLFIDLDCRRVLFATEGKDAATVAAFATDLAAHGGNPEAVAEVCIDMSPAFIAGAADSLPKAQITFDKFHVVKLINEAVDEVRRAEQKSRTELNKSRYLWLKNPQNLSDRQRTQLESLSGANLKTGRAYRMRLAFQELYAQPADEANAFLKKWYFWATHSRLPPMVEAARTVKRHWDGILRWFQSKIANGIMEAINSLVQAAKAKARGYRSMRNLKAIIYLIVGKLELALPT